MEPSKDQRFEPAWWTVQHAVVWQREEPSLRRDYEQRQASLNRDRIAHQGPDDAVFQDRPRTPRNIDVERAHLVTDNDWEVGTAWEQIEAGLRYGVGARVQYPEHPEWNEEVEARLQRDWQEKNAPNTWERVKRAVRRGFEYKNKDVS